MGAKYEECGCAEGSDFGGLVLNAELRGWHRGHVVRDEEVVDSLVRQEDIILMRRDEEVGNEEYPEDRARGIAGEDARRSAEVLSVFSIEAEYISQLRVEESEPV